jgi:hypothetical protein
MPRPHKSPRQRGLGLTETCPENGRHHLPERARRGLVRVDRNPHHSDRAVPHRRERAQNAPLFDMLKGSFLQRDSWLRVATCHGAFRQLHEQAPSLRVQIVSTRSQRRNYCNDWGFVEGIRGGAQPKVFGVYLDSGTAEHPSSTAGGTYGLRAINTIKFHIRRRTIAEELKAIQRVLDAPVIVPWFGGLLDNIPWAMATADSRERRHSFLASTHGDLANAAGIHRGRHHLASQSLFTAPKPT